VASLNWNGDQIKTRMRAAAKLGIDKTMADCVRDARSNHPAYPPVSQPGERYANRTGYDIAAIDLMEPAHTVAADSSKVTGRWGSTSEIALFLEIGTSRMDSGEPRAAEREAIGDGDMDAIPGPSDPPLMAPRPTLRPAADTHYPNLGKNIGAAYRGEKL
jgi:hypothetical protein